MRRRTAMTLITPITIPREILAAAAAARPSTAPQPAATAAPVRADTVYSNTAAPANDPTNAPITDPITGRGTPTTAPTNPPINAPQAARFEAPYFRANRNPSQVSMNSPRSASARTSVVVQRPTVWKSVNQP